MDTMDEMDEMDGMDGMDEMDGMDGMDGMDEMDGMEITSQTGNAHHPFPVTRNPSPVTARGARRHSSWT